MKIQFTGVYYGTYEEFLEEFNNVQVQEVDDKLVIGICEICGLPVLEDEEIVEGEDGSYDHKLCDLEDGFLC